jgi:hypothetical protein
MKAMNISKISIVLLGFISCFQATAQNTYSISGSVFDKQDDTTMVIGNVLLLYPSDSSLITGTVFNSTNFVLEGVTAEQALLRITALGYIDTTLTISNSSGNSTYKVGSVYLERAALSEFEVTASVLLFEQKGNNLIVNVDNSMLAGSESAEQILDKLPGVTASDGSVSVLGKGTAIIYKNGKRITAEQLAAIPVSMIDEIQVINNPPAKYDAQGRVVIDVVMKKKSLEGIYVKLNNSLTVGKATHNQAGATVSLGKNRLSLAANYNMKFGERWNLSEETRQLDRDSFALSSKLVTENTSTMKNYSSYGLELGYQLGNKTWVGAGYRGFSDALDLESNSQNMLALSNEPTETKFVASKTGPHKASSNALSIDFIQEIDTLRSEVYVGAQYSGHELDKKDITEEVIFENGFNVVQYDRQNLSKSNIDISSAQADLSKNRRNGATLELGVKYSEVRSESEVNFYSKGESSEEWAFSSLYSNNYEYEENTGAAYVQYYPTAIGKTTFSFGVRGENTEVQGYSVTLGRTTSDTSYFKVFPNLEVSRPLGKSIIGTLNYASRISRPGYRNLDPFIWYIDSLTSVQGSPGLLPETVHSLDATFQKKAVSVVASYGVTYSSSRMLVTEGTLGANNTVLRPINIDLMEYYSLAARVPFQKKGWSSYTTAQVSLDRVLESEYKLNLDQTTPQYYIYSYHRLTFLKHFSVDFTAEFGSSFNDGINKQDEFYQFHTGVAANLLDRKLFILLRWNDVLNSYKFGQSYQVGNISSEFDTYVANNFVKLYCSYSFGGRKKGQKRNKDITKEEAERVGTALD